MSNIYIQEPPTNGKVCLETTVGDIEIELWSRECPKACRNFVQLCMENYYNKTKFHRVIKDFIVQGGDPGNGKYNFVNICQCVIPAHPQVLPLNLPVVNIILNLVSFFRWRINLRSHI